MSALLSIPIASYCSIERLALIYFSYTQQDYKLNETGITSINLFQSLKYFSQNNTPKCLTTSQAQHLKIVLRSGLAFISVK